MNVREALSLLGDGDKTQQLGQINSLLTVLPCGRCDIPDAGRQLTLPSLIGGVTGTVAGAPPLLPVMLPSSSLS